MSNQAQQWMVKKPGRRGSFDGYTIQGIHYESTNADWAWHITAWKDHSPIKDYWVAHGKFYGLGIHFAYNARGDNLIQICDEIQNVPAAEKKAILKSIAEWESPLDEK